MPSPHFFTTLPAALLVAVSFGATTAGAQPATQSFDGNYGGTITAGARPSAQPFDGIYRGATRRIGGTEASCSQGGPITLDVRDGQFSQPWQPLQDFAVRIGADGHFYARSGSVLDQTDKHMMVVPVMEGQVRGNSIVADYGTRWCDYRLEATRS